MSAKLYSKANMSGIGLYQGYGFNKKCKNVSLSEIYLQKIKGKRSASQYWRIRGITGLQACSQKIERHKWLNNKDC
jgi:hypothetical protein